MGMVMGITSGVIAFAAALVGMMVSIALLFPCRTAAAQARLEQWPARCLFLGALITVLLGGPAVALLNAPHGLAKLAGWVVALPLFLSLALGLGAMAHLLGERMRGLSPELTPLAGMVRGGIVLLLPLLLPFVGWFLLTPVLAITLIGSGTPVLLKRRVVLAKTIVVDSLHPEPQDLPDQSIAAPVATA